jgi:hypothetical protein
MASDRQIESNRRNAALSSTSAVISGFSEASLLGAMRGIDRP